MKKIMIIEDNRKIREELCVFLSHNGYECDAPDRFDGMIERILCARAHLVLLDINLPVLDGYHICRELRKQSDVPVIVVTSRDTQMDELTAMSLGADDFVTKPYHTQILLARIESVLRRAYREAPEERLDCGAFSINLAKSICEAGEESFELTKNELRILACLRAKRGTIVSRDELMRYLWDSELFIDDNTLTVNVTRLRCKLEQAGLCDVIETRRGRGYLMK